MTEKQLRNLLYRHRSGRKNHPRLRAQYRKITRLCQAALDTWEAEDTKTPKKSLFQIIDFFCGCGGMSLGFASLAKIAPFFNLLGGIDIDKDACKTYETNFGVPGIQANITEMLNGNRRFSDVIKQLRGYSSKIPLIAIGCAPCQGFTSHRKKHWHKDDERNSLVGAFVEVALRLDPAVIIMENVPELLAKKYWGHFESARSMLHEAGYIVKQSIYNAATFGVPQERFRALVIAMKRDFLLPRPLLQPGTFVSVRKAIASLPPVDAGIAHPKDWMHKSANHRASTLATIKAVPHDGGSRPPGVGPKCLDRVRGFYDVYGRLAWDNPSITLTHYARNPASGRYVHPDQDRGLTMREVAILQSFPVGFSFCGSFDSIFKQIGEAVPPKMAATVAVNTLIELLSPEPSEEDVLCAPSNVTEPVSNSYSSVIAGIKQSARKNK